MNKIANYIPPHWQATLVAIISVIVLSIAAFFKTWQSIVDIWYRSQTFNHGFLIIPICLWLLWIKKRDYQPLYPSASWSGIFAVAVCGFVWLLAELIYVQVIRQMAVVLMLVFAFITVFIIGVFIFLLLLLSFAMKSILITTDW